MSGTQKATITAWFIDGPLAGVSMYPCISADDEITVTDANRHGPDRFTYRRLFLLPVDDGNVAAVYAVEKEGEKP